jgi:hypothetical protein
MCPPVPDEPAVLPAERGLTAGEKILDPLDSYEAFPGIEVESSRFSMTGGGPAVP